MLGRQFAALRETAAGEDVSMRRSHVAFVRAVLSYAIYEKLPPLAVTSTVTTGGAAPASEPTAPTVTVALPTPVAPEGPPASVADPTPEPPVPASEPAVEPASGPAPLAQDPAPAREGPATPASEPAAEPAPGPTPGAANSTEETDTPP